MMGVRIRNRDVDLNIVESLYRCWALIIVSVLSALCMTGSASGQLAWKSYTNSKYAYIAIDRGQKLWVGTMGGLVRFDKATQVSDLYTPANGLPDMHVTGLVSDRKQVLWVSCYQHGLANFDGAAWSYFHLTGVSGKKLEVTAMAVDSTNRLWIAGASTNPTDVLIASYDGNIWKKFTTTDGIPPIKISSLLATRTGSLWAIGAEQDSARRGFASAVEIVGNTLHSWKQEDGLPMKSVDGLGAIIEDRTGVIWVGGSTGVSALVGTQWKSYNLATNDSGLSTPVTFMANDKLGSVWIAGNNLQLLKSGHWVFTGFQGVLADPYYISGLVSPSAGVIWVATTNGCARHDGAGWTGYAVAQGLPDSSATWLTPDSQGEVLVATERGVAQYRSGHFFSYARSAEIPFLPTSYSPHTVVVDSLGRVWIVNALSGVAMLQSGVWKAYSRTDGLLNDTLNALTIDPHGTVWATGKSAIYEYNGSVWLPHFVFDSLTSLRNYTALMSDSAGHIWVAALSQIFTGTYILCIPLYREIADVYEYNPKLDGNKWLSHPIRVPRPDSWLGVASFACGPNGDIWAAAPQPLDSSNNFRDGLYHFSNGAWTSYSLDNNNPAKYMRSPTDIAIDRRGELWVTFRSVAVIDSKMDIINYPGNVSSFDGSTWHPFRDPNIFNSFDFYTSFVDRNNRKWIGCQDGVFLLDSTLKKSVLTQRDGLMDPFIFAIAGGPSGDIWFSTEHGIEELVGGERSGVTHSQTPFASGITVYPNPNVNSQYAMLNFKARKSGERVRIELVDLLGRSAQQPFECRLETENGNVRFAIGSHPSGMYFLNIETEEGRFRIPYELLR
jgi:ligand-binding sensor domain-containing protein